MATDLGIQVAGIQDDYKYGFRDSDDHYSFKSSKGLNREVVQQISEMKNEPRWMRDIRLQALDVFWQKPTPSWGGDLSHLDFNDIHYYMRAADRQGKTWDDVPAEIKNTFDKLGIPEAERKFLAGVGAQYESEVVYHSLREDLQKKGVIFVDTDTALREYPDLVRRVLRDGDPDARQQVRRAEYGGLVGWIVRLHPSGREGRHPAPGLLPDQRREHGPVRADTDHRRGGGAGPLRRGLHRAHVFDREPALGRGGDHHQEGGPLPLHDDPELGEQHLQPRDQARVAYEDALMEWVDGNLGSRLTMKYPAVYMLGKGARGEILSIAFAGKGQHQDAGAKVVHGAPYTSSRIISKSISKNGGRASYRGLVKVAAGAKGSRSKVVCDALILDDQSRSDTYPYIEIDEDDVKIGHEASVTKIGEEQLFYLMSRGLSEAEASTLIVSGFIEPLVKELPMEYAVEMNKLIQLQMEGSVG